MKAAIIDVGSNSVRLLCGERTDGIWAYEAKRLCKTRLGEREADGNLTAVAKEASFEALAEMRSAAERFGAERIYAFATSAVREAGNGADFLREAKERTGIDLRIWSEEEEAAYAFAGATGMYPRDGRHYLTVDIGGGSTELALGCGDDVYWSRSYPVGAVRLKAIAAEGIQRIWEETATMWEPLPIRGTFGEFIGVGGTVTTLAAVAQKLDVYDGAKVTGFELTREAVEGWALAFRYMSAEEAAELPGLPAERADIILAGTELLSSFMDAYEVGYIIVSDRDGMEGFLETAT